MVGWLSHHRCGGVPVDRDSSGAHIPVNGVVLQVPIPETRSGPTYAEPGILLRIVPEPMTLNAGATVTVESNRYVVRESDRVATSGEWMVTVDTCVWLRVRHGDQLVPPNVRNGLYSMTGPRRSAETEYRR